jgi:hypothetical protein
MLEKKSPKIYLLRKLAVDLNLLKKEQYSVFAMSNVAFV